MEQEDETSVVEGDEESPSMEEILQTIRGVISGDEEEGEEGAEPNAEAQEEMSGVEADEAEPEAPAEVEDVAESAEEEDVLELTDMVMEDGSVVNVNEEAIEEGGADAEMESSGDVLTDIDDALASPEEEPQEAEADPMAEFDEAPAADESAEVDPMAEFDEAPATESDEADPMADFDQADPFDEAGGDAPSEEGVTEDSALTEQEAEDALLDAIDEMDMSAEAEAELEADSSEGLVDAVTEVATDAAVESVRKGLLSEESAQASSETLRVLIQKAAKPYDGPAFRSGITLEELVIEMLKPELSAWLNEHLPALVKQIVEKEIQRLLPDDD